MYLCRSNSVEPQDRAGTVIGSPVCPVRHVLFVLCPHYAPHVCASLSECVRDSSTMITSRCENALWDNQYVWIWSELHTHTHTHTNTHTGLQDEECVFVCRWHTYGGLLPAPSPIKRQQWEQLVGVCWLPPEGTSPSAWARPTAPAPSPPPSPLVTANRPEQQASKHGSLWEIHGDDALQAEEMPRWVTFDFRGFFGICICTENVWMLIC